MGVRLELDLTQSGLSDLKGVSTALRNIDKLVKTGSTNVDAFKKQIRAASQGTQGLSRTMREATSAIKSFNEEGGRVNRTNRGMEVSFFRASLAADLVADGIRRAVHFAAEYALRAPVLAEQNRTLSVVTDALAGANNLNTTAVRAQVEAVQDLGITTRRSFDAVNNMIVAQVRLADATKVTRIAQNAAVVGLTDSSEALQRLIFGAVTRQPEVLRRLGIIVNFEQEFAAATRQVGRDLSESEKRQIAFNAVIRQGEKLIGTYEAAMTTTGKRIGSLTRFVEEAQFALGREFGPTLGDIVDLAEAGAKNTEKFATEIANLAKVAASVLAAGGIVRLATLIGSFTPVGGALRVTSGTLLRGAAVAGIGAGIFGALDQDPLDDVAPRVREARRRNARALQQRQNELQLLQFAQLDNPAASDFAAAQRILDGQSDRPGQFTAAQFRQAQRAAPDFAARPRVTEQDFVDLANQVADVQRRLINQVLDTALPQVEEARDRIAELEKSLAETPARNRIRETARGALEERDPRQNELARLRRFLSEFRIDVGGGRVLTAPDVEAFGEQLTRSRIFGDDPGGGVGGGDDPAAADRLRQLQKDIAKATESAVELRDALRLKAVPDDLDRVTAKYRELIAEIDRLAPGGAGDDARDALRQAFGLESNAVINKAVADLEKDLARIRERNADAFADASSRLGEAALDGPITSGSEAALERFNQGVFRRVAGANLTRDGLASRRQSLLQQQVAAQERIVELVAGPGGEFEAAVRIRDLRVGAAEQLFALSQRRQEDETDRVLARNDAQLQFETRLAELQNRRSEQFREAVGQAFDALRSGGGGLGDFFNAQLVGIQRTLAQNFGQELFNAVGSSGLTLPGQTNRSGGLNLFGRLLRGTPLGVTPEEQLRKANTSALRGLTKSVNSLTVTLGGSAAVPGAVGAGTSLLTDIGGLLRTPPFLPSGTASVGSSRGQGGLIPIGGIDPNNPNGPIVGASGQVFTPGGGFNLGGFLGKASTVGAGALGILAGIREGGARGSLTAVSSGLLAGGSFVPGPVGQALQGVGLGLGFVRALLPDRRKQRAREIANLLEAATFDAPDEASFFLDTAGNALGRDRSGSLLALGALEAPSSGRSVQVNVTISAVDSKSFLDRRGDVADALREAIVADNHPVGPFLAEQGVRI